MALALYRRYRPDSFDGVIGQDQVTVPLMRALDNNKLTHAYLFSGPRGCGKTSSARILARCINCEKGPTSAPCGECASCKDLATGGPGSIDVVEIDAASHNGVDDARELRERAGFAPARDRYKIFILDEAHMVTQQGFNALLKIVEEPPEHVMFIFATTEPDKVIGTIRSRTHHYPFRLVPQEVMGPYLETICKDEGIEPEPGVLRLAMRAGGGSVRDTLSVLDQLMVGAVDGKITYDSAVALLGFTPDVLIGEAFDAIIDGDGAKLYGVIQKVVVGGFDARRFVEDLLARARDLLVLTLGGEQAESVLSDDSAAENMQELHRQAEALGLQRLSVIAQMIDDTLAEMVGAISPRMRLELLAARLLASKNVQIVPAQTAPAQLTGSAGSAQHAPNRFGPGGNAGGNQAQGGFIGNMNRTAAPNHAAAQQNAPAQTATASNAQNPEHAARNAAASWGTGASSGMPMDAPTTQPQQSRQTGQPVQAATVVSQQDHGASNAPQPQATSDQSAKPSAAAQVPANATPDQRWDALVNSLPDDIHQYVDRKHVPRVNYDVKNPAHKRLWAKFDTPLSKYAFALAVATEAVDGKTSVVDILRAKVHEFFGPDVVFAPTQRMADGQSAPPWSKLSAEEQQKFKAQMLKAKLQGTMNLQTGTANLESKNAAAHETHANAQSGEGQSTAAASDSDSDAVHRGWPSNSTAAPTSSGPFATSGHSESPAEGGASASDHAQEALQQAASSLAGSGFDMEDDPWASPMATMSPTIDFARMEKLEEKQKANAPVHAPQRRSIPDLGAHAQQDAQQGVNPGQSEDPWNSMPSNPAMNGNENNGVNVTAGGNGQSPASQHNPQEADMGSQGAPDPWQQFEAEQQRQHQQPQVDAEHDEYSLTDESLGDATAVDLDELKKLFEVKKEEDFDAQDPHNPLNMQSNNSNKEQ